MTVDVQANKWINDIASLINDEIRPNMLKKTVHSQFVKGEHKQTIEVNSNLRGQTAQFKSNYFLSKYLES